MTCYLELKYDQLAAGLPGEVQKNGNISQLLWRVRSRERQVYGFKYDAYDRMEKADYIDYADSESKSMNNRSGTTYDYDVRGNISTITRNGQYWDGSCSPLGPPEGGRHALTPPPFEEAGRGLHQCPVQLPQPSQTHHL